MDPLSISASVVTLAGLAIQLGKYASSLHNAPAEILALSNEMVDLNLLVVKLESVRSDDQIPGHWNHDLRKILDPLKLKIQELSTFVNACESSGALSEFKSRLKWPMVQSKAQALQKDLREIRLNTITYLAAQSATNAGYTVANTNQINSVVERIFLVNQDIRSQVRSGYEKQARSLSEISQQLVSLEVLQEIREHAVESVRTLRNLSGVIPFRPGSDKPAYESPRSLHSASGSNGAKLLDLIEKGNPGEDYVAIQLRSIRKASCQAWCSCSCHQRYRFRTPEFLEKALGALFVGYTGMPIVQPKCNENACKDRASFSCLVQYQFPLWFIARTISLVVMDSFFTGSLTAWTIVRRVVPHNSEIFRLAKRGDVGGLKALLAARQATPNDVHSTARWTALHFAIQFGHIEACKLLLDAGTDRHLADGHQRSPNDYAWTTILGGQAEPAVIDGLSSLFVDNEGLDQHQFSVVHKIVLGLVLRDLSEHLELSTANINDIDSSGRTALSWAARRGDANATKILLSYGADPNKGNVHNVAPLHHAVGARNPSCISLLIEAGADVDQRDARMQAPLHYAALYRDNPAFVEAVLAANADVNTQAFEGCTPLTNAATRNHSNLARYFLNHGADIELADYNGTPLLNAIAYNSHAVLKVLLANRASCGARDSMGNTVLHKAAECADLETLELLMEADISELDPKACNNEGKRAIDLVNERQVISEDFSQVWKELLTRTTTEQYFDCLESVCIV